MLSSNYCDPNNRFDNFVVTPTNEFAYRACRAFAEGNTALCNPIFLYGSVGVGKTHLLHATVKITNKRRNAFNPFSKVF